MGADRYYPTDEDREALDLLSQRDDLTQWEECLLESLEAQAEGDPGTGTWSHQQHLAFDELFERKFGDGGRVR